MADGLSVLDLVPDDPRIRLVHIEEGYEIGSKRNFGCERASGEIVAHWDDDDWSAPERLRDQIGRMSATAKPVTGYHSMAFTDGEKWWKYRGVPSYAMGTSLCYRRDWWEKHPFSPLQVGEDNAFVAIAHVTAALASAEAGSLMYATIHPNNTSPRTFGDNFSEIACPFPSLFPAKPLQI